MEILPSDRWSKHHGHKLLQAAMEMILDPTLEPMMVLATFDLLIIEIMMRLFDAPLAVEHLRTIADTWERRLLADIPASSPRQA